MNSLADGENYYLVNNFRLALTMVLLKLRKDVKLTTLGGRLFQATATRSLNFFLLYRPSGGLVNSASVKTYN